MTAPAIIPGGDRVPRRAMFVLELLDPVTGAPAGASLEARAEGLRAPSVTRAGQFVWLDIDPPADRQVKVSANARSMDYQPFTETLAVAARSATTPPTLIQRTLQPTGAYRPPTGRIAAAGMLIDDKTARLPLAGAEVVLVLDADTLGVEMRSAFTAITDAKGAFVAVGTGFADRVPEPAPRPAPDGSVTGRVEVTWLGTTRARVVTLRGAQLNYLSDPLIWGEPNL